MQNCVTVLHKKDIAYSTLFEIFRLDAFFKALDQVTQQATVAISAAGDEPKSWEREQLLGFFDCKVARLYHMNSSGVRA